MNHLTLKLPPLLQVVIALALMWLLAHYVPIARIHFSYQHVVGVALSAVGAAICLWCGFNFLSNKTTLDPRSPDRASTLVTAGIYRLSRNPMYVSFLIALSGAAIYLGAISSFLVLPLFVYYMNRFQIIPEERALTGKFGDQYESYCARVRRWL